MGIKAYFAQLGFTGFIAQGEQFCLADLAFAIKDGEVFTHLDATHAQMMCELWSEGVWLFGFPWPGKIKLRHYRNIAN
jgi:hypothetical protein